MSVSLLPYGDAINRLWLCTTLQIPTVAIVSKFQVVVCLFFQTQNPWVKAWHHIGCISTATNHQQAWYEPFCYSVSSHSRNYNWDQPNRVLWLKKPARSNSRNRRSSSSSLLTFLLLGPIAAALDLTPSFNHDLPDLAPCSVRLI